MQSNILKQLLLWTVHPLLLQGHAEACVHTQALTDNSLTFLLFRQAMCVQDRLPSSTSTFSGLNFFQICDRWSKRDVLVVWFQPDLWNSWGWLLASPDTSFQASHFSLSVSQLYRTQTQCFFLPQEMEGSIASPGHRWSCQSPSSCYINYCSIWGLGDFGWLFWHHWHTSAFGSWAPGHPLKQHGQRAGSNACRDLTELMKTTTENKQHFEVLDPCCYWLGCTSTIEPELCAKWGKNSSKMVYMLTIWLHLKDTITTACPKESKGVKMLAKEMQLDKPFCPFQTCSWLSAPWHFPNWPSS